MPFNPVGFIINTLHTNLQYFSTIPLYQILFRKIRSKIYLKFLHKFHNIFSLFPPPRSFLVQSSSILIAHPSLHYFSFQIGSFANFTSTFENSPRYSSKNSRRKYFTTPFEPSKWIINRERANSNVFRDVWFISKPTFILHPPFYGWQKSLWKQFDSREYLLFLPSFDLPSSIIRLRVIVLRISRWKSILDWWSFFPLGRGSSQMPRVSISSSQ